MAAAWIIMMFTQTNLITSMLPITCWRAFKPIARAMYGWSATVILINMIPSSKLILPFFLPDLEKSGGVKGSIYKDTDGDMYVGGVTISSGFGQRLSSPSPDVPEFILPTLRCWTIRTMNCWQKMRFGFIIIRTILLLNFPLLILPAGRWNILTNWMDLTRDWITAGDRNSVSYSNLDGGHYVFRVRAFGKEISGTKSMPSLASASFPVLEALVVPGFMCHCCRRRCLWIVSL